MDDFGSIPRFGSPLSSNVVVCGHRLVTLPLTINATSQWFSPLPILMQNDSDDNSIASGIAPPSPPPPRLLHPHPRILVPASNSPETLFGVKQLSLKNEQESVVRLTAVGANTVSNYSVLFM